MKVTEKYWFYVLFVFAQTHLTFQDEWTVPESSVMEAYVQYVGMDPVFTLSTTGDAARRKKKQHVFILQTL